MKGENLVAYGRPKVLNYLPDIFAFGKKSRFIFVMGIVDGRLGYGDWLNLYFMKKLGTHTLYTVYIVIPLMSIT